jgi:hypothetical protein
MFYLFRSFRLAAFAALFSFKLLVGSFLVIFSLLTFSFDIVVSFKVNTYSKVKDFSFGYSVLLLKNVKILLIGFCLG